MAEKKKHGKKESRGILAQFHASGLTQRQFAEQEGVPLSTLSYWIRRDRLERKISGDTTLVAVAEESGTSGTTFILEFEGIRMEVPRDVSVEEWQRLREAWTS